MVSKLGHSIRLHVGGNTVTEVSWSGQRPDRRVIRNDTLKMEEIVVIAMVVLNRMGGGGGQLWSTSSICGLTKFNKYYIKTAKLMSSSSNNTIGVEKQQCGRLDYKAHSNVKREKHEASRYHTTPQCPLPKLRTSSIAVASTRDTVAGRISPKQIVLSATIAFLRPLLPHSVARVFGVSVSELTCVLGKGREDSLGHSQKLASELFNRAGKIHLDVCWGKRLAECQAISDEGLQLVSQFSRLWFLCLISKTNDGLKPLFGS
ncbi:hypothetical protein F8388_006776 [Cannabis sativa]|uniref:Uncharacterized protein n=1 Tax=Cannabis sativa TaxID=3483 RepID=A0A7J6GVI6_CANSA|nr:hypothetical protein F8388_006776 [Cannabis sativa]